MNAFETSPLMLKDAISNNSINYSHNKRSKYSFVSTVNIDTDGSCDESAEPEQLIIKQRKSDYSMIGGLFCVAIALLTWVVMSEVIQSSEQSNFNKPFFVRYMVQSAYSLMIVPWFFVFLLNKHVLSRRMVLTHWTSPSTTLSWTWSLTALSPWTRSLSASASPSPQNCEKAKGELVMTHHLRKSGFRIVLALMVINMFSLFGNYIWYLSLSRTYVLPLMPRFH